MLALAVACLLGSRSELVGWFQSSLLLELGMPQSSTPEARLVGGALDKKSGGILAFVIPLALHVHKIVATSRYLSRYHIY